MIRVFGSNTCGKCHAIVNGLRLLQKPFEYIDAMAEDTQDFCDKHNIGPLPHIQIYDEQGNVLWEKAQIVTLTDIVQADKTNVQG